jgi:SAM-dependent methyltransferase
LVQVDGQFCAKLRAAGWPSVAGIDISRTRVARARQLYPEIPFYDCPIEEAPIPEQSLDVVVMDSVIEHLPNPIRMVRSLYRFVKPNGMLVLLTPNIESGYFRFLGRRSTGMLAPLVHICPFTGPALSDLLIRAGFAVLSYGSLHSPAYKPLEYLRPLTSGDVKGTVWRAHQEIGGLYSRVIRSGPFLYAVANRPPLS